MLLTRFVRIQLLIFSIITVVSLVVMGIFYMQIPAAVGLGKEKVYVELPNTGGIYGTANVTYRGVTVGKVTAVDLDPRGVRVTASIDSDADIPADVTAEVHSASAIGEQYIDFVPRSDRGGFLGDGATIPVDRVTVPQPIGPMIDQVNTSLESLPPAQLNSLIDEASRAFVGTGPDLHNLVSAGNSLISSTHDNLDMLSSLIANASPFLGSQISSAQTIPIWMNKAADITGQIAGNNEAFTRILTGAPGAEDLATSLFSQVKPTLPIMLANLVTQANILVTYNPAVEQLLVLIPQGISAEQSITVMNRETTGRGTFAFNLNLNNPEPCTTGFLPASQRRPGTDVDSPPRPDTPIYCAIPQSDQNATRGARNLPCLDHPGKRAPTVEMCDSDEQYRPQGRTPWIGPDQPAAGTPGTSAFVPGTYNPDTGEYTGPDGNVYVHKDLDGSAPGQSVSRILMPS